MATAKNMVQLLAVGEVDRRLLEEVREELPSYFDIACEILPRSFNPEPCFHVERQQYHSSEILQRMRSIADGAWRVLGITPVDLYIPILKYVFGEAQVGGPCALVSFHRLRQEYYGLDPNDEILAARVVKESIHELGHTLGLKHCQDYRCAMASAHAVEWIDLREASLCNMCRSQAEYVIGEQTPRPA